MGRWTPRAPADPPNFTGAGAPMSSSCCPGGPCEPWCVCVYTHTYIYMCIYIYICIFIYMYKFSNHHVDTHIHPQRNIIALTNNLDESPSPYTPGLGVLIPKAAAVTASYGSWSQSPEIWSIGALWAGCTKRDGGFHLGICILPLKQACFTL